MGEEDDTVNKTAKPNYRKQARAPSILTAVSVLAGIASALLAVYMISLLWEGKGFSDLLPPAAGVILCQLVKAAFYAAALWKAHDFAYSFLLDIRLALIDKLKTLPLSFFQKRKSGELAGIVDHDVERVSVARAFLKDAPILLLDEVTSNVDPLNEVLIQKAISALSESRTVLMIAHHPQIAQSAERILVFDGGRISEIGTHGELLALGGVYTRLWNAQAEAREWGVA
jgi:ABC-type multidrug transport system fused ATPase/permease subunit